MLPTLTSLYRAIAARMRDLALPGVCLLLVQPGLAWADIYRYVSDDGVAHFTDQPNDPRYRLYMAQRAAPRTLQHWSMGNSRLPTARFRSEVLAAAQANRVDPALLHAVIAVESGYNPTAVSSRGAVGLMQLMPETARRYQVDDPLNAAQNVQGGARLLRALLDQFQNNLDLTLAAYNAGDGTVQKYGRTIPPYAETMHFVPAVLAHYARNRNDLSLLRP